MNYTKLLTKYIFPLFGPINAYMELLREIDFKLDAQKISELLGALKTLKGSFKDYKIDEMQIKFSLHDFNECYEYFNIMITQTWNEFEHTVDAKGLEKIKVFLKMGRDVYGFGGGSFDRSSKLMTKGITYTFYKMLSRFGKEISTELINKRNKISIKTINNVSNELEDSNAIQFFVFGIYALYISKRKGILTGYPDFFTNELVEMIDAKGNELPWTRRKGLYFMLKYNIRPLIKETLIIFWFCNYLDALKYSIATNKELKDFAEVMPKKWEFYDIIK